MKRSMVRIAAFATVMGSIAGFVVLRAQEPQDINRLLADAKGQSYAVSFDAAILNSYMRQPQLHWKTHAIEITRMKEDINLVGKTVAKLNESRVGAAGWQKNAIDRIIPLMQEIAANTTAAIEFLNNNQTQPLITGDYRDYIESNADLSGQLSDLIAKYVDYGNTKDRYENLRKSIQISR